MKSKKIIFIIFFIVFIIAFTVLVGFIGKMAYQNHNVSKPQDKPKSDEVFRDLLASSIAKKEQYKYIVVINPAHGENDAGYQNSGIKEKDITLSIAQMVKGLNQDPDVGIFLTRDSDINPSLEQRNDMVEQMNADVFIDLNVEKDSSSSTMGTSVFYKSDYYNSRITNVELADIMEHSIVSAIEGNAIGIFEGDDKKYPLLVNRKIPSVSISCGYISNDKEREMLSRQAYQTNFAKGILSAIDEVISK